MTIVMTILASDNARNRRRAERAAKREQAAEDMRLARKVATAASGCSLNVARATSAPSLRDKHESTSQCLPEIAIFAAGYRNSKDIVTAR